MTASILQFELRPSTVYVTSVRAFRVKNPDQFKVDPIRAIDPFHQLVFVRGRSHVHAENRAEEYAGRVFRHSTWVGVDKNVLDVTCDDVEDLLGGNGLLFGLSMQAARVDRVEGATSALISHQSGAFLATASDLRDATDLGNVHVHADFPREEGWRHHDVSCFPVRGVLLQRVLADIPRIGLPPPPGAA